MAVPIIAVDELHRLIPQATDIRPPIAGGQKLVFPCVISGRQYVLKVLRCDQPTTGNTGTEDFPIADEVFARARREVEILERCDCPYLPKIGPVKLQTIPHEGQHLAVFSEELIDGDNLHEILRNGPLDAAEIIRLADNINSAIEELWRYRKIHRDIKPANIVRRGADGAYVLLDPGIAFDLDDQSITHSGHMVRTRGFVAPELLSFDAKRDADCRADHFLLGIVLYIACTGQHPFITAPGIEELEINRNIRDLTPPQPRQRRGAVPQDVSEIVMRLLQKRSHQRFRSCEQLRSRLAQCER